MNEVTIAFLFRGINMMLVTLGGILSIYLGWKLYRDGIASSVESEMQHGDKWKFTMKALGPGVFFALFGMWILVTVIGKQVSTETGNAPIEIEDAIGATEAGEDVDVSARKVSFLQNFIPSAQAQVQPPRRYRICTTYTRTVSYDGDIISKQDFQTAIDNAVVALRAGEFDAKTQEQANQAISILARLGSANGGSVK